MLKVSVHLATLITPRKRICDFCSFERAVELYIIRSNVQHTLRRAYSRIIRVKCGSVFKKAGYRTSGGAYFTESVLNLSRSPMRTLNKIRIGFYEAFINVALVCLLCRAKLKSVSNFEAKRQYLDYISTTV